MTDLWSFWCCLRCENTNKQNNNFERDWFCKYCLSILYVTQDKDLTYLKRLHVTHPSDALQTPASSQPPTGCFHFSSATYKQTTWWRTQTPLQSFSWVVTATVGEKNDDGLTLWSKPEDELCINCMVYLSLTPSFLGYPNCEQHLGLFFGCTWIQKGLATIKLSLKPIDFLRDQLPLRDSWNRSQQVGLIKQNVALTSVAILITNCSSYWSEVRRAELHHTV